MPNTYFDAEKITAGNFTPVSGTAMDLGCTGSLSGDTDVRTITKICEGSPVKEVSKPRFMTLTFSGHLYTEAYRELFGLKADVVLTTKFAYGVNSKNKMGAFKWEVENLEGTEKKTITFPNAVVNTGFAFSYENGAEEIAEVELTIKAMPDVNGDIYTETIAAIV